MPGRRKLEGLVFSRGLAESGWEKGRGAISLTISTNFTPAAGGLSVTYVAAACDNRVYQTEHLKVASLGGRAHLEEGPFGSRLAASLGFLLDFEHTGSCKCGVAYRTRLTYSNRFVP
jgi:hypothetical protein